MTVHKLQRSGNAPLLIDGELISDAEGSQFRDKKRSRYFRILIFRTADGYAAQVRFFTSWEGEAEWHTAAAVRNLAQLVEWLNSCQRLPPRIGYPVGEQFERRQAALMAELDAQYASLVSEVLGADCLDWANDRPPTPGEVFTAMDAIDEAMAGGGVEDLRYWIGIVQSAKQGDIVTAISQVAEEQAEVPDALV